ncbi:AzlC family ABC transporter permease [Aquibaculum arenosum]|uniref:AzlC family ABC transporter permease n=1 Tax=Aquibaculum arenosum TaxID=3032591 RepID=A0ABT5YQB6_9PROT|nr:AzlC family ABC transporter permease [Fodinicurvata sp. CAU 1616]MDF2096925.1 AzlC family ABC transporter permease [Fodinicurvata sp. CAU 1616]
MSELGEGTASALRRAWLQGMREAGGTPAAVLGAGYIGFGALARDADFSLLLSLVSTFAIWALPGQIALIELYNLGTAAPALILAVMLTAARFFPMTASLLPSLRHPRWRAPHYYLAGHLVAMTGWAVAMRRFPQMRRVERLPYFLGFTVLLWLACAAGTIIGYQLSYLFTDLVTLGLVFLNPMYFFLVLCGETRSRLGVTALLCGAIAGPLLHLLVPEWSLILAGVLGGTLAFLLLETGQRRS